MEIARLGRSLLLVFGRCEGGSVVAFDVYIRRFLAPFTAVVTLFSVV